MTHLNASPQPAHAVPPVKPGGCYECGGSLDGQRHDARFCSNQCRTAFNNRRQIRGAAIYDLLMAMRYERDEAKRENVWTMLCRIASDFRAEDERNRDGRRSWMPARAVLRRMPHLNSQVLG